MLNSETIIDKYSVADYAIIYLGNRHPSQTVNPDIRYCVEQTPARELCKDRNGNIMIFDTEAQAFECRKALGITYPVLAFYDRPMPDFLQDYDEPEGPIDEDFEIPDIEEALA
jgi:hypothetical protein